jgi:CRISPR-associated endonuclease/helicase Cas3
MNSTPLLAHPGQSLVDHLSGVARRAELFAGWFGAACHGNLAGLLHDLGKAEGAFQVRMEAIKAGKKDPGDKQPHAHHGAALALAEDHWLVAFTVNGHHAGLHNRSDLAKRADYEQRAKECLAKLQSEGFNALPKEFGPLLPESLERLAEIPQQQMLAVELFTRFLFSALVDADRLDTEESDPEAKAAATTRKEWLFNGESLTLPDGSPNSDARPFDAAALLKQTNEFVAAKRRDQSLLIGREQNVQRVRNEVASHCLTGGDHAGDRTRGLFSLTVPTGGGKTLASMLFALSHAQAHAQDESRQNGVVWKPLRRVIVVIPYLSIIQQTAFEFQKVFGDLVWKKDAVNPTTGQKSKHPVTGEEGAWLENDDSNHKRVVLEHHSNAADPVLDEKKVAQGKASDYSRARSLRQLAAENWDAPIIVTTSVQFFDSLFSRRPADARKLHNIAQSVIIFDEVQTFPPHLLQPILGVLGELANPDRPYGCSAVFCTATQPALGHDADEFPVGLKNIRPIVPPETAGDHFKNLKRVGYSGIQKDAEPEILTADQVAERAIANERKQCLVVVNTRKSAREVFTAVQQKAGELKDAVFHLSTWMIPAHRLQVLEEVRRRLSEKKPCFLVSTQCIEAGVDVDFPEVWRAYGPYDSIVQAAGRCNREGKLKDTASGQPKLGAVRVFRLEGDDPEGRSGIYGTATAQTTLLRKMGRALPEDPTSFGDYFRLLYQISVPDECLIQQNRAELRFEQVSELFRFIEDRTFPVLVREFVENGQQRKTKSFEIYEKAQGRRFFTRDDWRVFQRDIINLPLYNRDALLGEHAITPALRGTDESLYVFTGDAYYEGGLNGFGFNPKAEYSERTVL